MTPIGRIAAVFTGAEDELAACQDPVVRALREQLDRHDAEHTGAWGVPDEAGCPFC